MDKAWPKKIHQWSKNILLQTKKQRKTYNQLEDEPLE